MADDYQGTCLRCALDGKMCETCAQYALAAPANLRRIDSGPNPECIGALEIALEEARAGKLTGIVILGSGPSSYCDAFEGGDFNLGDCMYTFECWKTRHIEQKLKGKKL